MATKTKARYRRPWLYDVQREAVFAPERYAIIEASTKSGKTVGCMVWLAEQAMTGGPGKSYWWLAPVYSQAKMVFGRLKRALPREVYKSNESDLTLTLVNGAVIWFKTAEKPDALYGEDVYAAVMDEATRIREESWHAIRSTLTATRGPIRIIGNVKGRKNWAYRLARKAEAGEPDMHYAKITAHDAVAAGVLAGAEIEDARRILPDSVFRELYLAEPSDDEGNPFGIGAIQLCIADMTPHDVSAWGWDLAKSVDWTVGVGLDINGAVCRFERFQKPWGETERFILRTIENDPAAIDSTGVGDPIVEMLQRELVRIESFKFTSSSKQQLMEGLAVAIQAGTVRFPDGPIVTELEAFEYEYTRTGVRYSAPQGMYDDCVCALALAVYKWNQIHKSVPSMDLVGALADTGMESAWRIE